MCVTSTVVKFASSAKNSTLRITFLLFKAYMNLKNGAHDPSPRAIMTVLIIAGDGITWNGN